MTVEVPQKFKVKRSNFYTTARHYLCKKLRNHQ